MKFLSVTSSLLVLSLIVFTSCKHNTDSLPVDGVWQQLGYGKIYQIEKDSIKIYDLCRVGCGLYDHVALSSKGKVLSFSDDSLIIKKNIKTYRFERLDKLPSICIESGTKSNDPVYNFEFLWNTFQENYCYFEDRNIDWTEKYNSYRSKVTKETSDLELFLLMDEMLSSINDSHIDLSAPEALVDTIKVLKQTEVKSGGVKQKISSFQLADQIAEKYCKDLKTHNAGIAKWGLMENNMGYIQLNAMWLVAYYDVDKNLDLENFVNAYAKIMDQRVFQRQDEIDGANLLMDTIFTDLMNTNGIVIDLRFNGGGKDEVGLEMIGHLVKDKTKVGSKKAKLKTGFTNQQNIYLESGSTYYDKEVYLLTSHLTASASELAVLATLGLDNVTRIGSKTEGIFSDRLDKKLPNGWDFTLSNEIYEDLNGNSYEGKGVPPNIELNYSEDKAEFVNSVLAQLNGAGDAAIEKAFELQK